MLTLNADSACDVCAEEYGPFNLPRCIPCGHVLCATCADTIIDKTSPRLQPACPFCREPFARDGVRVIRIDFSGSSGGGSTSANALGVGDGGALGATETCIDGGAMALMDDETVLYDVRQSRSPLHSARASRDPSRATSLERPSPSSPSGSHPPNGIFTTINEDHPTLPSSFDAAAHKERARELEKKVAKVATKRCSAEEVQALQRELGEWMSIDKVLGSSGLSSSDKQQHAAIHLSHLLLRAILMNHLAHSEASRVAKGAEAQLRSRIADGELVREKLDADLRKTKNLLQTRSHEVSLLKAELARLRGEDYSDHNHNHNHNNKTDRAQGAVTPTRRQSLSAPTSPDGYFSSFAFSSASTAVPPASSSRSNPASGANSPCSSGRTTPTAGLALANPMMPMGSAFPPIGVAMMSTSGGMSSASASAAAAARPSMSGPTRAQSTAPTRPGTTTPTRPQSTAPARSSPASPTPAPSARYAHARSASMIHRSATATPGLSSSSTSASTSAASNANANANANTAPASGPTGRERRSMTPAPVHQRSASVAPGSSSSSSAAAAARGLTRSMTPNLSSSRSGVGNSKESGTGTGAGNGSSAGGASLNGSGVSGLGLGLGLGLGIPPVPSLPGAKDRERETVPVSALSHSLHSSFRDRDSSSSGSTASSGQGGTGVGAGAGRPPVPPKPRTLSQSQSQPQSQSQASGGSPLRGGTGRGVVDDRDGYATEKEKELKERERDGRMGTGIGIGMKKEKRRHERWLPSALMDRMSRPATSQS